MQIKLTQPLANCLIQIPYSTGVYRFYDKDQRLLYVGKAINLYLRVKSYFNKNNLSPRISLMVNKIATIEITLTDNENSALILENNLIKNLKPRYNIIFRDDKSYPYIRVTKHDFPLLELYRQNNVKNSTSVNDIIFGPYPNAYALKQTLELLYQLFQLRSCSDSEFARRKQPCLLYQIKRCHAPCVNLISKEDYNLALNQAKNLLSGNYPPLIEQFSQQMLSYAQHLEFEKAASIRDQIKFIQQLHTKQIINDNQQLIDADIILAKQLNQTWFIYLILLRNGSYVADKSFQFENLAEFNILEGFIEEYYANPQHQVKQVFCSILLNAQLIQFLANTYQIKLSYSFNQRIQELYQMGEKNLAKLIENSKINTIYLDGANYLANYLQIELINRIECYDISHNHASSAVASLVVYEQGKIRPQLYRRYNLPSSCAGDDVASIAYVIKRRLMNASLNLPEVMLIDGGILQLNSVKNSLNQLGFHDKIKVIALSKGEHRKPELDNLIVNPTTKLAYSSNREIFRLVQGLRDEAHRFAITGHRKQQVKRMQGSVLDEITGIGKAKRQALLAFFGSTAGIAQADINQLRQVKGVGLNLAKQIYQFFHK